MRAELYPLCVPGAEVVALATLINDGYAHGWFRDTYGEHWGTATLTGVVNTVTDTAAQIRWEDGDHVEVLGGPGGGCARKPVGIPSPPRGGR
jgi:hypothetical protein